MPTHPKITLVITVLAVCAMALTLRSHAQRPASAPPASAAPPRTAPTQAPAPTPDFSKATWDLPADADKTKNPIEPTEESVAKGKELFMGKKGNCVFCHGETGAGNAENLPKLRRKPADLSDKERMTTISDGEIFWKVTRGIPGIMPGREKQLTEEERWNVVNFVRTLAKDKPALNDQ
jgi:mono/diheme cytochrome c family protein